MLPLGRAKGICTLLCENANPVPLARALSVMVGKARARELAAMDAWLDKSMVQPTKSMAAFKSKHNSLTRSRTMNTRAMNLNKSRTAK